MKNRCGWEGLPKKQEQDTGIMGALYGTPWSFEVCNGQP